MQSVTSRRSLLPGPACVRGGSPKKRPLRMRFWMWATCQFSGDEDTPWGLGEHRSHCPAVAVWLLRFPRLVTARTCKAHGSSCYIWAFEKYWTFSRCRVQMLSPSRPWGSECAPSAGSGATDYKTGHAGCRHGDMLPQCGTRLLEGTVGNPELAPGSSGR